MTKTKPKLMSFTGSLRGMLTAWQVGSAEQHVKLFKEMICILRRFNRWFHANISYGISLYVSTRFKHFMSDVRIPETMKYKCSLSFCYQKHCSSSYWAATKLLLVFQSIYVGRPCKSPWVNSYYRIKTVIYEPVICLAAGTTFRAGCSRELLNINQN